jgi:uncharacterized protein (TIGR03382 family)
VIPIAGGIVDDGDACFVGGGDPMYLHRVTAAGADGDLLWTYATDAASEFTSATWNLYMAQAGRYKMEVYTDSAYGNSKKALYAVRASGNTLAPVAIDQSAFNGWQLIGEYDFAAAGDQYIHLGDNTGEPSAGKTQIAIDGVRLTRVGKTDEPGVDGKEITSGCSSTGAVHSSVVLSLLTLVVLIGRRRDMVAALPSTTDESKKCASI